MRKKTEKEFELQVSEIGRGDYLLLSAYKKDGEKVKMRHLVCGHEYSVAPSSFLQGRGCPKCKGIKISQVTSKPFSYYKERAEALNREGYKVISVKREGGYIHLYVMHEDCKREYWVSDSNYRKGKGCKPCSFATMGKTHRKKDEQYKNEVRLLGGGEFEVIGEYVSATEKIKIKHKKCGFVHSMLPYHFIGGTRCPRCSGKLRRTTETYIAEVSELVGGEYEVLGEYKNRQTAIKMKHMTCGLEFSPLPTHFISGSRCPACATSRGEQKIKNYLIEKGIEFKAQYKTPDCKNILPLPFDFAVFKEKKLVALIEFQGGQHYKSVEWFGGQKAFEKRKFNDKIKKDYCQSNKIKLIEVMHDNKDVPGFIEQQLTLAL